MPIVLQPDPIFSFDTGQLGCLQVKGYSLKIAGTLMKEFEKFKKAKPEVAIRYLLTLVAYHTQANDKETKNLIILKETKLIEKNELIEFSRKYREHLRILYSHEDEKEDLAKILRNLNEIEKLQKILIIKVELYKKQNEALTKKISSISSSHLFPNDIAKKFAASNKITNAVSQAFGQFKRFDDLYGNSFARITKDIQIRENLIKSSMTPFCSSYADIVSSLKPELDRVRELYSSSPIIDSMNQANSNLATLFSGQASLTRLATEAVSINKLWKTEIDSIKHFSSSFEASKVALGLHYDGIAQASLLAQERLVSSHWNNLEKSIFHKTGELTGALESFNSLANPFLNCQHQN